MTIDPGRPVLVLGIGNILWADEGFGVRCVEELHRRWSFDDDVLVMDGGTQGLYLVHYVQAAKRIVVFDAIDYGEEPGTLKLVRGDEVPKFTGAKKMSLHQTGFQDVLSAAELLGGTLEDILLIGVQALELEDYGGSLTPPVRAQLEPALAIALDQLAAWGHPGTARTAPPDSLLLGGIDLAGYEAGRPSAEDACRVGDFRFFAWRDRSAMCIGIPMELRSKNGPTGLCSGRGEDREVSLLLVGDQPVGTWVLVHVDTAIRTLDPAEVPLINDALDALEAVERGDPFEHLFADLIGREPQLPDHLKESRNGQ